MSNIKAVSKLAGVSVATVSRAFARPDEVSETSRAKVFEAAKHLGYRPNLMARNFRARRSFAIMVLVPNIANPFFSRVISGIEDVAQARGYSVLLGSTGGNVERERAYASMAISGQADGVIQLSARYPFEDASQSSAIPLVNICECFEAPGVPQVELDNEAGAHAAITHLLDLGHTDFGIITGPPSSPLTAARLQGCQTALRDVGASLPPAAIAQGDFSMEAGVKGVQSLMQAPVPPTAIFCFNDEMAMGALAHLRDLGCGIPQDVSVVGFDDIAFARFAHPPLTTIAQPAEQLGRRGGEIIIDLIEASARGEQAQTPRGRERLPCKLTVRASTGAAPDR